MNENLIHCISKLSTIIVTQQLESDKNLKRYDEKLFDTYVGILKQKGFDVLLGRTDGTPLNDPCVTYYGGKWSPVTLITDIGRELMSQGAEKASDKIKSCISILTEKNYNCVNDLLKLLLLLKRPLNKEPFQIFQSDSSFSSSDFLLKGIDSMEYLNEANSSDALPKTSLFRKGIHYEESWTKHFDSKFQLLGEFSKKNYQSSEFMSLDSKPPLRTQNQSRISFVFTDFVQERNQKSDRSLFQIHRIPKDNEIPLLDSFVDNPIQHKLPSSTCTSKFNFYTDFKMAKSSVKMPDSNESVKESNVIELKRDSNCSHSFSILCKKEMESEHSYFEGTSYCLKNSKIEDEKNNSTLSMSKNIILGLWEQEVSLIKQFKPELARGFPELRMISLTKFVSDIKYLLTGINSGTFQLDLVGNKFNMVYGTCLNDVTPESLFHFSKDFIEIGNCYLSLTVSLSKVGLHNLNTCTTISQAFWKSIVDFLELHYALVLDIPPNINLMSLKSYIKDDHQMMMTVANICMADQAKKDLQSGELISYLIRVAEQTYRDSTTNVVFGILKNCCSVYFAYILQKWLFKGELDTTHNEFFVGCGSHKINIKSRAYYSSFSLNYEKVPSFLRGFENSIYNCGKSIHFLKLFNPEDKFCQILNKTDYPSMRICFSEEQLEKLEEDFKTYEKRVLQICGEKITIKTIKEEEKEKEKAYIESIKKFKKIAAEQQEAVRQKMLEANKAKKEKQNKELNKQKNLIEEEKKKKKKKEQAEELKLKEKVEKEHLRKENLINQEKSLMISQYNDLFKVSDRRITVAEKRKEKLKESLNEAFNDNQTDKEGNLTSELDINSNRSEETSEKSFWENETKSWEEGTENEEFDENSNPSSKNQHLEVSRSVYCRPSAAEEAKKNKFRVLKSEFALSVPSPLSSLPATPKEPMTALEKNKQKVLESELNLIFQPDINNKTLKSTSEILNLPIQKNSYCELSGFESAQSISFSAVELKSKPNCSNLARNVEKSYDLDSLNSESTDSFMTPPTETSFENLSSGCEERRNSSKSSLFLNDFRNALARDSEIVSSRLSTQDIFCRLREEELKNLPCKNYCSFLKFLKQSIFIPLSVQERLASDALLKHILKGENFLSHLNSLRGYFFLNDGEFGRSFTHHTFRSLAKCTESSQFFEKSNLNNIVNEALNYTIHNLEPNAQNLSFRIRKMPPFLNHSSHNVLSPFELTYKVDWPLNIILTEKALNKYKMVFRFLLKLKRINWTLNENFSYFNWQFKSNRQNGKVLVESSHFHKIQIYRHAMTQVVITIDDYIFSNGIQLPWIVFLKDLETTKNIDDLYQKHVRYIKDVLTECFLSKNSEDLLECIHNLLELSLKFHYTAKSSGLVLEKGTYIHPKFSVLKTTFNEFCYVLKTFLKTLKEKIYSNQVIRSHYVLIEKFDQILT